MAVAVEGLPPPGSSQLEVMFRRMLLHCYHHTQQQAAHEDGNWSELAVPLIQIVEALQEKLYELEQNDADRPSNDVLQQYKACVKAISEELRPQQLPAYCLKATARQSRPYEGNSTGAAAGTAQAQVTADKLLRSTRAQQAAARDTGKISPTSPAAPDRTPKPSAAHSTPPPAAAAAARPTAGSSEIADAAFTLSNGAQEKLQTQQRLQDELTTELLDMGQELKASTVAMQNAIRFRGKILDDTEVYLEHSTANAHSVAAKAKQQYKQSSWNFCQTLLLLLAVAVIFCGMIVYIKLTSMVGLKGR